MSYALVGGSAQRTQVSATNTATLAVDVGSGSNRLLLVGVMQRGGTLQAITSITYNGVAMSLDKTADETSLANDLRASIYRLIAPDTGSHNISITWAGSVSQAEIQAAAYTDADQTSPLDQTGQDVSASGAAPSVTLVPTTNGQLLFGICIHEDANAMTSGLTTLFNFDNGAFVTSSEYTIQTTATSQAVGWTAGAAANYVALAASYKPVSGSALVKVINETVQLVEPIVRRMAMVRLKAETENVVEVIVRTRVMVRIAGEVENVVEVIVRSRVMVRIASEVENIVEGILRRSALVRRINEFENIVEGTLRTRGIVRVTSETENIVEGTVRIRGLVRVVSEVVAVVESILEVLGVPQTMRDTLFKGMWRGIRRSMGSQ